MANTLGVYDPIFYAQEALIHLEKALGMGSRVHRGFEAERNTFGRGQVINIRKPSTFTAANAPASAVDLDTETVAITLDQWKEVKFKLSDKELAYTQERIIAEHIRPAAYALADNIDLALVALYKDVPWFFAQGGAWIPGDLTLTRKVLFDNAVPLFDGNVHMMVSSTAEADLLADAAFSQQQGAGDAGISTQLRGSLGTKYGMEIFSNQNTPTHTKGTSTDTALAIDNGGAVAKGAITCAAMDGATFTGTVVAGDTFVIAGNTQRYAFTTASITAGGDQIDNPTWTPGLAAEAAEDAVVTARFATAPLSMAFHRNAFALVLAPLPTIGQELGARVVTVTDPVTGLSLRSRLYYVGDSSEVHVALDVLYGVKTLDPNMAVNVFDDET